MADLDELASIANASEHLLAGQFSAVELTEHFLLRIAAVDDLVRAFVTVTPERALADAHNADAVLAVERHGVSGAHPPAGPLGPLTGIPIALKDLIATRGIRTTAGSRVLADHIPDADAPIVGYLAAAGAVLLGKTNTHEFAYGTFTAPTRNPWDLERIPGGSSGGSAAAVAAGECLGAIGSDTGGSIRIPASCCGVTGFKPTYGVVDATGVIPLSWSLDHVGPIARSVADCAVLLDGLVNGNSTVPRQPLSTVERASATDGGLEPRQYREAIADRAVTIEGLRIGVPTNYFFTHVDAEVEAAVRTGIRLLAGLGAIVVEIAVPSAIDDLFVVYRAVQGPEATLAHSDAGWWPAHAELYQPSTRAALERGEAYTAAQYIRAQRAKRAFEREMQALFATIDVLVCPTLPLVAPRVVDLELPLQVGGRAEGAGSALLRLTFPFDISGQPALTIPCGFSAAGLPIGMQLVGQRFDEFTVLRAGHAYQHDTNWHLRRAPLANPPA